jgi:signal peptidase
VTGTRRRDREKGLLHYIWLGLSAGLLALVLLLAALVVAIPAFSGSTALTILTSSMEPAYPPGTLIVVRPLAATEIRIGDAITYQLESGQPEVVTHRVTAISSTGGDLSFTTRGDNNGADDEKPVLPVQVNGRVWYSVPYVGYVNTLLSGANRAWVVPIAAVLLFGYAGYMFASGASESRRARKRRVLG